MKIQNNLLLSMKLQCGKLSFFVQICVFERGVMRGKMRAPIEN